MTTTDYQKGVCQCRSCSSIFHQSEVVRIQTEHNGLERICPKCGSHTYGVVDYPVDEIELLFNSKFYRNNGKYIRLYIDKMMEEE